MVMLPQFALLLALLALGFGPATIAGCTFDVPPTNCASCIRLDSSCTWCTDDTFDDSLRGPQHRCGTIEELLARGCKENAIENPESDMKVVQADILSDSSQISPQNISMKARIKRPMVFNFTFKQALNYPVDLYILSDKSHSMRDFLHSVANMSEKIQQTLGELTKNWRIGVGFFVDKPVFPYVQPNPSGITCDNLDEGERCIPTFSYIHAMTLSQNTAELKRVTAAKTISANLDSPEGSLDALLQSVVCAKQVGWRQNSRKVVLLAVDGGFHMAGDGRFGGIIEPYPETQCHLEIGANKLNLTGSLEYVNATRYDYPSIGQVAKVLSAAKVSVIFALKSANYKSLYDQLKVALPVATEVDLVINDNVLTIIRNNYRSIAETVEIRANNPGHSINITTEVMCPGEFNYKAEKKCPKVQLGQEVQYRATITVTGCLPRGHEIVQFTSQTSNDKLEVYVQSLCNCPECEARAKPAEKVAKCQNNGYLECGVCSCHGNFSGDSCQCDSQLGSQIDQCRDGAGGPICTLRGRCVCNTCVCSEQQYYSKYCELDRLSCRLSWDTQEICGGEKRGKCDGKGNCKCEEGYSDKDCSCSEVQKRNPNCHSRKEQFKGMLCSNHGICSCGRCYCEAMWSLDPHCDTKAGSTGSLCADPGLRDCVNCIFANRKLASDERLRQCNCTLAEESVVIDKSRIQLTSQSELLKDKSTCVLNSPNECNLLYGYTTSDSSFDGRSVKNMTLYIQDEMQCRERVSPLHLVLIVVAAVVIIGIIILVIWKLLVTISDKREYAKFQKMQANAQHGATENPLFSDPTTTVKNPLFEGHLQSSN